MYIRSLTPSQIIHRIHNDTLDQIWSYQRYSFISILEYPSLWSSLQILGFNREHNCWCSVLLPNALCVPVHAYTVCIPISTPYLTLGAAEAWTLHPLHPGSQCTLSGPVSDLNMSAPLPWVMQLMSPPLQLIHLPCSPTFLSVILMTLLLTPLQTHSVSIQSICLTIPPLPLLPHISLVSSIS